MQDININGHGNFSGGEYSDVTVNGAANCEEPVVCGSMRINGSLSAERITANTLRVDGRLSAKGDVSAERLDINGMMSAAGNVQSDALDVDGSLKVGGHLNAGDTSVDGRLKCEGSMAVADFDCDGMATVLSGLCAQDVKVDGMLNVTGSIEAASVESHGKISATNQISADTIHLEGIVNADEIVGDFIEIHFKNLAGIAAGLINSIFGSKLRDDSCCANLIEATTVVLDGVHATTVSGQTVTIGKNCTVERVECTGELTIDPTSVVRFVNGAPFTPGVVG